MKCVPGFLVFLLMAATGCQSRESAPPIILTPVVHETIATPAPHAATGRLVGVGSCTASGCHGGGKPGEILGSEYNIWISDDPHAEAFSVLYDAESFRMVQLLDGTKAVTPYADDRCLACHSTIMAKPRDDGGAVVSDGVGCEACHGPAEHWLGPHVAGRLDAASRAQLGMWDTKRLSSRAKICTDCHVGGPGREVDHDLIAAGHPRLQFEMGAYFEALPKHWDELRDRSPQTGKFDVLTWAVGQAATSQAALEQLARRAASGKAWPELSEWSCSACHHDLRYEEEERQQSLAEAGNLSGRSIAWDDWNHHLPRHYLRAIEKAFQLETSTGQTIEAEITALQKLVEATRSDRGAVAERAATLAADLSEWAIALERTTVDRRALDLLSLYIARNHLSKKFTSWSSAAQAYDALASMHQSRSEMARLEAAGNGDDAQLTESLSQLFAELAARYAAADYVYQPQQVQKKFEQVRQVLKEMVKTP